MPFDPFLLIIAAAIGLFIFMQFRTSKKRRTEAEKLQEKMVPGTEIMTNYGLYGTIISVDEDTNVAVIETTPGTQLRIHRQTILKTVEDEVVEADDAEATEEAIAGEISDNAEGVTTEPEFGERVTDAEKPARKGAKKSES